MEFLSVKPRTELEILASSSILMSGNAKTKVGLDEHGDCLLIVSDVDTRFLGLETETQILKSISNPGKPLCSDI